MKDFKQIQKWLAEADAVIVTAGNGFAQMRGLICLRTRLIQLNIKQ